MYESDGLMLHQQLGYPGVSVEGQGVGGGGMLPFCVPRQGRDSGHCCSLQQLWQQGPSSRPRASTGWGQFLRLGLEGDGLAQCCFDTRLCKDNTED